MLIPKDLKYSKTHEWVKVEGDIATIGITDYAQSALGEIVYVELPEEDEEVAKEDEVGTIESVKSASPIYTPVSGKIIEINSDLDENPELINEQPYDAFLFKIELSDPDELNDLMEADEYETFLEEEENH